jgi:antitoxin (DNA-binding transcriptional repressor) of toxin-antitoxin stability system
VAFKAHCLRIMDEVARRRQPLTITKRRKAIVRLVPLEPAPNAFVGIAANLILHAEALDAPIGEPWNAEV